MHGNSDSLADRPGKSPVRFRAPCATERPAIGGGAHDAGPGRARRRSVRCSGVDGAGAVRTVRRGDRGWDAIAAGAVLGGLRACPFAHRPRPSSVAQKPLRALRLPASRTAGSQRRAIGGARRQRGAAPTGAHEARCDGASRPIPARPGPRRPAAKGASGFRRGRLRSPAPRTGRAAASGADRRIARLAAPAPTARRVSACGSRRRAG